MVVQALRSGATQVDAVTQVALIKPSSDGVKKKKKTKMKTKRK